MHFTEPLYSNPMIRPIPLLEVTQGCTHNKCAFCNMYKSVRFRPSPSEWVEADIRELAVRNPGATRLELVGANPFCLSFERLDAIMDFSKRVALPLSMTPGGFKIFQRQVYV